MPPTANDVLADRAKWCVIHTESEAFLRTQAEGTYDGGVFDPPYGLGTREPTADEIIAYLSGQATLDTGGDFMGEAWSLPPVSFWREVFRVLKPGAWIAVFGGTQTDDLLSIGLRAAGFERQDAIDVFGTSRLAWVQAQGMLKGLNISKAIDEAAGLERVVVGTRDRYHDGVTRQRLGDHANGIKILACSENGVADITAPASPEAARWDGHNTAVAPKHEPVLLFRKPLAQVTSAQLYAATGWDHWHSIRDLRRPEAQAEAAARFGCDVPEKARVVTKRALHSGVTSRVELQAGDGWAVLAVRDEEPYREWSTRTVAANVLVHGCAGALPIDCPLPSISGGCPRIRGGGFAAWCPTRPHRRPPVPPATNRRHGRQQYLRCGALCRARDGCACDQLLDGDASSPRARSLPMINRVAAMEFIVP